jgi:nucleoside-diphosphate-sugar epimerase
VVEALSGIDEVHGGVDAVVHLAAIPGATFAPNVATFANNLLSTFHVFQAAKLLRIHNLVWASSETLLGYPFAKPPVYVPLDEEVPPTPEVAYSLVKDLDEEMARQFCRWNPDQKMIGLRFSNVMEPHDCAAFPAFEDDPASRKWNLWSYIDARDGAQAVVRALAHDRPGFDIFNVANPDTVMSRPSADLMAEFFPDVKFRTPVEGTQALCSIDKARRVLNWQPQHLFGVARCLADPPLPHSKLLNNIRKRLRRHGSTSTRRKPTFAAWS